MSPSKHITPYQDLAIENVNKNSLKQLVSAILLSAVEDADVEFLTDDYDEWKYYREKRKKKNEFFTEIEYQLELLCIIYFPCLCHLYSDHFLSVH